MIRAAIVGGSGYTGVELLRLLVGHPSVDLVAITSRGEAGRSVPDLFPSLRGRVDLRFVAPESAALAGCDVVFFATPHGAAMRMVPELLASAVQVIDLGPDFRLRDPAVWSQWYGMEHACPELLEEAVYGLPEVNREALRSARLVAAPGCYPTAVQLGFLPLLEARVVDESLLIADAKSGVSGAGRRAAVSMLHAEASDSLKAYGVPGHRHLPEIQQGLQRIAGRPVGLTFVPHLAPMIRGIHATLYARVRDRSVDLQALYETRFAGESFVDVLPAGSHPETRAVRGANVCRLAVHKPQGGDMAVVLSVIDNLVKGAAGQAVQAMNIMFGLDETVGLQGLPLMP
jgi:N-acetyl-gamma-glutamyl-phosphate reductase